MSAKDYGKEERALRTVAHVSLVTRGVIGDKSGFASLFWKHLSRGNLGALWGIRCKTNAFPNVFTLQRKAGIL